MAEVIDIQEHLPKPDADMVESARVILSEVQAGRVIAFATVYVTSDGDIDSVYHFSNSLELVGAAAVLHQHAISALTE